MEVEQVGKEIQALLSLADDSDAEVVEAVHRRSLQLLSANRVAVLAELGSLQKSSREKLTSVMAELRRAALLRCADVLASFLGKGRQDLHDVEAVLTQFSLLWDPFVQSVPISDRLDALALRVHDVFQTMPVKNELSHILAINQVIFEEEGFGGARDDYYNPGNSFLGSVLESKRGLPISLSALYMMVAGRTGAEIKGIGLPLHFIVYSPALDVFLDPFSGGVFLSRDLCRDFIERNGYKFRDDMLEEAPPKTIIVRVLRNIVHALSMGGDRAMGEMISTLLQMAERHDE